MTQKNAPASRLSNRRSPIPIFAAFALPACLLSSCLLTGCQEQVDPNLRPVFPVSGRIVYRGQPIPDATVCLHPVKTFEDDKPMVLPRATVNSEGAFIVSTYNTNDGAPAGQYHVTVSWSGPLDGLDEDAQDALRERIPRKYLNVQTTDLVVDVADKEHNQLSEIQIR